MGKLGYAHGEGKNNFFVSLPYQALREKNLGANFDSGETFKNVKKIFLFLLLILGLQANYSKTTLKR